MRNKKVPQGEREEEMENREVGKDELDLKGSTCTRESTMILKKQFQKEKVQFRDNIC